MHFLEDIIADWAGAAPLAAIGDRLLHEFAADCFGDFRGSLVGLLAAYNYELSILQACSHLTKPPDEPSSIGPDSSQMHTECTKTQ